jgi:general secretion pathway protein H
MARRGFTLVEVIVVLLVLALLAGAATLPLSGFKERWKMQHEAEVLRGKLAALQTEALMRNLDLGLVVEPGAYRFKSRNQNRWEDFAEAPFEAYALPDNLVLKVDAEAAKDSAPPVIFRSTGEMRFSTLHLKLKSDQTREVALGAKAGRVRLDAK